jgi:uncharacterized small protein (DUF1192 family)
MNKHQKYRDRLKARIAVLEAEVARLSAHIQRQGGNAPHPEAKK